MKKTILIFLILCIATAIVGQKKSYSCIFFVPKIQKTLLQKVLHFDSLILRHGCALEGCMNHRCIGIGFRKGKLYAVRIEFPFVGKKFDHGQIICKLISDPLWEDSVKHINIRKLILLNSDSLNFHDRGHKGCTVFDGGSDRMIFIQKDSIWIKSSFEPEEYQECDYTNDRQIFINTLNLLNKHYYYTRKEQKQYSSEN